MSTEVVECKKRAGEPGAGPAPSLWGQWFGRRCLAPLLIDAVASLPLDGPPSGMWLGFYSLSYVVLPFVPGFPPMQLDTFFVEL